MVNAKLAVSELAVMTELLVVDMKAWGVCWEKLPPEVGRRHANASVVLGVNSTSDRGDSKKEKAGLLMPAASAEVVEDCGSSSRTKGELLPMEARLARGFGETPSLVAFLLRSDR